MRGTGFDLSLHPCIVGWRMAWPALAELAARTGYRGAVIPRNQPLPAETKSAVRATSMQLPVEVRKDDATFLAMLPRLEAACRFAAEAGCHVASLSLPPSSERPREVQAAIYRERLRRCCEVLEKYSIRLALECITPLHSRRAHPHEFIWRNEEMLEFGSTVSPQCGLIIDAWHWYHAGADPGGIRTIPADRILDVHISDSPAAPPEDIRDLERLLPGEGIVDFGSFFDLLREKSYAGLLTVEVFGRGLSEMDPQQAARLAFEASAETLRKAGLAASSPSVENATALDSPEA